ncbi:hypothetical protein FVER53590_25018 [Fusarium verticillioides]|nr:hypothetical protein FVER53590_25018 [Fusarium verticillioides]
MAAEEIYVKMSDWLCAKGNTALTTSGLSTCIRVAIVGEYPTGFDGPDRFLAHISEEPGWAGLCDAMRSAIDNAINAHGFRVTKVVLVIPDTASEEDEDFEDFVEEVVGKFAGLVNSVEEHVHDTGEAWKLGINSEREIWYGAE